MFRAGPEQTEVVVDGHFVYILCWIHFYFDSTLIHLYQAAEHSDRHTLGELGRVTDSSLIHGFDLCECRACGLIIYIVHNSCDDKIAFIGNGQPSNIGI